MKSEIPQFLKEIMEKCWNFKPLNCPTAEELRTRFFEFSYNYNKGDEIRNQIIAANKSNKNFIQYDPNEMHPEAIYTKTKQWDFIIPDDITEKNEIREH
ncbi:hypothetical protein Glove_217g67 [Diversispora epigaea]|uniref:Serine-threonine/tyrosine-protein kinase catalytic domain-containing protein n=1 Tax=Diversispora epigaea TaxID=1348612 RepID=A0A397IN69_9GLOM|nr:hypothetical protein Glove_217g67 [Diversispora epigaea]